MWQKRWKIGTVGHRDSCRNVAGLHPRQTVRWCWGCDAPFKVNKNSREVNCTTCRGIKP